MSAFRLFLTFIAFAIAGETSAAPIQGPASPYHFSVPSGWTATSLGDGTIVSSGDAYVRIVKVSGGGKDEQLVQRVVEQVGKQWSQFKQDESGQAKLGGSDGTYQFLSGINPKGVQATMRVVAAPFGDDAYMLIMSAPSSDFLNLKEAFKLIEHSFTLSPGGTRTTAGGGVPARPAPAGMRTVDGSGGGRILFSPLTGVTSGQDAFRSGLVKIRGYFDSKPKLLSAVTSKDRDITICVFNASLDGSQVTGLATATYNPAGASNFAVVFDSPDHLKTSLTPMMRQVHEMAQSAIERSRPAGGGLRIDYAKLIAESKKVALSPAAFPAKVGTIGIASGYNPSLRQDGSALIKGEDGSYLNLMGTDAMLDPRGSIYKNERDLAHRIGKESLGVTEQVFIEYDPNPVSAWRKFMTTLSRQRAVPDPNPQIQHEQPMKDVAAPQTGALVSGTMTINGEQFAFTGAMATSGPPSREGSWTLSVTILAAPINRASADFPKLFAMQRSVRLDLGTLTAVANQTMARMNEETQRWIAQYKEASDDVRNTQFEHAMANAAAHRDAMDRVTAGWINVIRDRSVVQHNPTGAHGALDMNLAGALERSDPQNFSPVPLSQYVKGIDY